MKQAVGFLLAIFCLPLLYFLQLEIKNEIRDATHYKQYISNSIELSAPIVEEPITLLDNNGQIFAEEYVEWRDPLPLASVPYFVQQLFIESEDKIFYDHRGYDIAGIARAFAVNASNDSIQQGASTITQQVVRMRFLSTEKTYERKFKEILYAAELETQTSKEEILEMYLNEMYFGNRVYGIGGAATYYFSKPLNELHEAEMAFIAAIPNNPTFYNPIDHFDRTKKRQELLLSVMQKNGIITAEEEEAFKAFPITLSLKKKERDFPVYSTYVLHELEQLIAEAEGFNKKFAQASDDNAKNIIQEQLHHRIADVMRSGIIIETALDRDKQQQDEEGLNTLLPSNGLQAGAAVIQNDTREIISLYGGKDYQKADFHRAFQAYRQPGSTIKPLLVYAPFFESGPYHENTPVDSSNICIQSYCPKNFGNYSFGITSVREAFYNSYNTTAVRLLQRVGIEEAFAHLAPFQFEKITPQDYTVSAALGGFTVGVTPLELASGYSSFIDGTYRKPHAIRAVKDRQGNVLFEWKNERIDVWSSPTVNSIRTVMQDVVTKGTGNGITYRTYYTGAKTGTTDYFNDLWVAGMNDHYTTAVWVGFDKRQSVAFYRDNKLHLRAFSTLLR